MPADTSARYYQWFMSTDPGARIVAYEWFPEDGVIVSSMTLGTLYLKIRPTEADVWGPGRRIGGVNEMPWVVAQNFTRREGFTVEEAVQ